MKKIMTIAAAITVATLSSTAMAGDWFVGLEGGKANNKTSGYTEIPGGQLSLSDKKVKSKFYGVRVGKYIDDNVRIYGSISKNKFNDSDVKEINQSGYGKVIKDQKSLMFSSDYVFMKDSSIRPFAGVSLGASRIGFAGKNKTGLAYGAQAGVMFQAGPVDMEIGAKYIGNNAKVKHDGAEFKLKNSRQAYLSASYRF